MSRTADAMIVCEECLDDLGRALVRLGDVGGYDSARLCHRDACDLYEKGDLRYCAERILASHAYLHGRLSPSYRKACDALERVGLMPQRPLYR